jgi:hypothetical protein
MPADGAALLAVEDFRARNFFIREGFAEWR